MRGDGFPVTHSVQAETGKVLDNSEDGIYVFGVGTR